MRGPYLTSRCYIPLGCRSHAYHMAPTHTWTVMLAFGEKIIDDNNVSFLYGNITNNNNKKEKKKKRTFKLYIIKTPSRVHPTRVL